jgi:hypothetical protein
VPFAVQFELDPRSATVLSPIIDTIERADAEAMTSHRAKIAPHVSLAVYDRLDSAAMAVALQSFVHGLRAQPVQLASLGIFPAPSSVPFAARVVSAELLALHRAFHQATWALAASC